MGSSSSIVARAALVGAALLTACGGGGTGGGGGNPSTVEESLTALGVDITPTPRQADEATHQPLPESYSPFGAARTFDRIDELMTIGFQLSPASFGFDSLVTVLEEQQSPSSPGTYSTEAIFAPPAASTPWATASGASPATLRAATAGDVDADGLEELIVVSHTAGDASVALRVVQDRTAGFISDAPVALSDAVPVGLAVAAGDLDGDGQVDAVAAVATATDVRLVFLSGSGASLAPSGKVVTLTPASASSVLDVSMAVGNLDDDPGEELVVVMNEAFMVGGAESGTARYWVFDDGGADFALRRQAQPVSASAGGATRAALTATVAVGDIDGDNVDEIVLAGLTNLDLGGTCAYAYLLIAVDQLDPAPARSLQAMGASYQSTLFPPGSVCTDLRMRTVKVLTLDRDGDGADEIQANQLAFDDFRAANPWTPLGPSTPGQTDVPLHRLFGGTGDTYAGTLDRSTFALAAGDLTADKKADLVLYSQSASPAVRIWAVSVDQSAGGQELWRETVAIPTATTPAEPLWPVLVAANVDRDSMSIQYSPAERRVIFTQPIVIAALAAAPCARTLGQNLDACRTAFGTAKSTQVETEFTYTVTAGIVVGGKTNASIPGLVFELEVAGSIKASWGAKLNRSYTLTKRVVRTTGPLEDGVIFTSIPYDQFVYRILSHPNPLLVGTDVVVSIPRSPIETMVERQFFNDHVPADALKVDSIVFGHTPGQPRSYPTVAQRDVLVGGRPELVNGPLDVGQGGGSTTAEINVATQLGAGVSYGVEAELEVKATAANVMLGFTIGASAGASLQVSRGSESYYAGTVSNIAADMYSPATAYAFGLMAYIHDDPRQSFEVVNYWVQ